MDFVSYAPATSLGNYIQFYWIGSIKMLSPLSVSVLPITMQNLLFFPEDHPFRIEKGKVEKMPRCCLIGMISEPSNYILKGKVKIIGVRFTPLGFSKLFRLLPSEFVDKAIDFSLVDKADVDELSSKLHEAKNDNMRLDLLDTYFKSRLSNLAKNDLVEKQIQWSIDLINVCNGNVRIKKVASQLNISERHLRRIFRQSTGLSPKLFSEITRYNEVYKYIISGRHDWFELLERFGYHDQSHFIKEFKKFTNKPPSAFDSNFKDFDQFHRY